MTRESYITAQPHSEEAVMKKPVSGDDVFIGPRYDVVTNEAVPLLNLRARDVGEIYNNQPMSYAGEFTRYRHDVAMAAGAGALRLADRYPEMTFNQQVDRYVEDTIDPAIRMGRTIETQDALYDEAVDSVGELTEALVQKTRQNEEEIRAVRAEANRQIVSVQRKLIEARIVLVEQGATKEQLEAYDAILMRVDTTTEAEVKNESDTDRFWAQVGHRAISGARSIVASLKTPTIR